MTKKRSIQYSHCLSCLVQSQIYCQNVEPCIGTRHRIPHWNLGLRKYHPAWWNKMPINRKSCKIKVLIYIMGRYAICRSHLRIFLSTSSSNGSLIEWKIALFHIFFVRSTFALNQAIEKCQFLTFKVNFLCQKLSESFSIFFHWRISI